MALKIALLMVEQEVKLSKLIHAEGPVYVGSNSRFAALEKLSRIYSFAKLFNEEWYA